MSVSQTWVHKTLLAIDLFFALVILRDADVTISSYCGLMCRWSPSKPNGPYWSPRKSAPLGWKLLYRFLNFLSTGHCEAAIAADTQRAQQALNRLRAKVKL